MKFAPILAVLVAVAVAAPTSKFDVGLKFPVNLLLERSAVDDMDGTAPLSEDTVFSKQTLISKVYF